MGSIANVNSITKTLAESVENHTVVD